ncbi:hypothetical protein [Sodalis sp. (in: enterobacteria)]|uniref:hypothetical protein n=1 Tax=Sodalis sp. (in: enterobacteria) TaxID=1898979 RepID=UPI003F684D1E
MILVIRQVINKEFLTFSRRHAAKNFYQFFDDELVYAFNAGQPGSSIIVVPIHKYGILPSM